MHDETKHAPGKKEEWEARAGKALRPPAELYTAIRRECAVLCCAVATLPITNLAGKVPSGPLGASQEHEGSSSAYHTHFKFVCVCVF